MKELPAAAAVLVLAAAAAQAARPDVVLVMTDDQGYGDFGATGNQAIETPHIDTLARESGWMETFYVSPVCSPTRASLMTGRYNYRTRVIDTYVGRSMMDPGEVTVAEVLRDAGYATGIFGKWHLGDCYPLRASDQGFEEALVHRGGGLAQPSEPRENEGRYTDPILFRNGEQVKTRGYCTSVYFTAALEFLERAHRAGRNFFVYLPTNAPHGPFDDVPEDLRRHYLEEKREALAGLIRAPLEGKRREAEIDRLARIAAMITDIDRNMGRLLGRLEELGLEESTLVLFLVDNGPNTPRYAGAFRGHKASVHEGGIRSPLWARWPALIRAGTRRTELAAHIDVMPTILEACGVEPPRAVRLDGRSFLGLLAGERTEWPERTLAIQSHRGDVPVRYHHFMIRDSRWKLVHPSGFGRESFDGAPRFELYDLAADPGETRDRIDERPEVAERLRKAYEAWFDDVSSTRPGNYAPPRIWAGTAYENPTVLTRQDWRGGTWARDALGYWELRLEPGRYDVRLLFEPAREEETAELHVQGLSKRMDAAPGTRECEFRGLELPGGDGRLEAALVAGGRRRGVYQVEVRRR